jgi:hypothetical protein
VIKIEVTGNSVGELADKLLAIGSSLLVGDNDRIAYNGAAQERRNAKLEATMPELREEVFAPTVSVPAQVINLGNAPLEVASFGTTEASQTVTPSLIVEPAPEPEVTQASSPAPVVEASASKLNFDTDVAPHVLALVKERGKPVAQEILSQFGVEKASLLDPARWPELVSVLKYAM